MSALWLTMTMATPPTTHAASLEERAAAEVDGLHEFFEGWFNGVLEPTEENFARAANVLAPEFILIGPGGQQTPQATVLERIRAAHGSWSRTTDEGTKPGGKIWIENFGVRFVEGRQLLATYEEWQEIDGKVRARISSVLFRIEDDAPNGVRWIHLQETWTQTP